MKERTINITVLFSMEDLPVGATIVPKEKVKEIIEKEMTERFGWDIGFNDLKVDIIDKDSEVEIMDEKKFVTMEMFEQYHKRLMEYIGMHDDLILNGETTCPKCGATIKSDKCDKCATENEVVE